MNTQLIKLFNVAIQESILPFEEVNNEAMQRGYIVEPNACTESVLNFLKEQDINYNATFYKTFEDVISKNRVEILFDQLLHYITTYGTDFSFGNGYVPNDGAINIQTTFSTFKVIKVISEKELADKCFNMLNAGVALKTDTMHVVADYYIKYVSDNKISVDVDSIKNKEALIYICDKLNIMPNDKFSLFRYIMYKTTGSELIIKNQSKINEIINSKTQFDFSVLSQKNLESLASIFLRYKELFLAFKHTISYEYDNTYTYRFLKSTKNVPSKNAPIINKLRKLSVKHHEPMTQGFWQTVFTSQKTAEELIEHVSELTTYKKIVLMQNCVERAAKKDNHFYLIRNQKSFIRSNYNINNDRNYLALVYAILHASVINTLKANSLKEVKSDIQENGEPTIIKVPKTVRLVKGMKVGMPTSEKSFIGNYPFGTTYNLSEHNYFGIYWRNEWNTNDFDLSFIDINGNKIGWNSDFYTENENIVFSGDMTNADPEATEVLYMKKTGKQGFIKVNQYNGENISKFRFFFGKDDIKDFKINYMVDPASIVMQFDVDINNQKEIQVGVVDADKIVLMSINTGNLRTSRRSSNNINENNIIDAIMTKANSFIFADDMLRDADFTIVDDSFEGPVDIDFNNLNKDDLISLMK